MYKSPFAEKNKLNLIIKGLTSKYTQRTESMFKAYAKNIDELFEATPGGVVVFFPSFEFLSRVEAHIVSRPRIIQKQSSTPEENAKLMDNFRKMKTLLLAVQGGSLAEGVNLSSGEIKTLIIVGLALSDMTLETKALIEYYDKKFKKGWDYGYLIPAFNKVLQAAGRCIRSETDRGVIVFLDERYSTNTYFRLFPKYAKMKVTVLYNSLIDHFFKNDH